MKQTAWSCLAAVGIAAWAVTAPLLAVAAESAPGRGMDNPPAAAATATPAKSGKRTTYPFRGVVAAVDANARTVTLEGRNNRRVIAVLPETRFSRDGASVGFDDMKSGEAVGGTLRKSAEGQEEAILIRIGARPDARPPAKATREADPRVP